MTQIWLSFVILIGLIGQLAQAFYVSPSKNFGFNLVFYDDLTAFMLSGNFPDLKVNSMEPSWMAMGFNSQPKMVSLSLRVSFKSHSVSFIYL